MNISKFKLCWKAISGALNPWGSAFGNVADYLLDVANSAVGKIDPKNKTKIQAALNVVQKVAQSLSAIAWLCPTKWQSAYTKTLMAVACVVDALGDLVLTAEEVKTIQGNFNTAVLSWKSPDDETCVDCIDCNDCRME